MFIDKKKSIIKTSGLATINPGLFKELESLIQNLKNSQRCFAEAASLVNSSQLRNLFEKLELERTIFMETVAKAIERSDLTSGHRGYDANIAWFASVDINSTSKEQFDFDILSRCMQSEETIYQSYKYLISLRGKEKILVFLDKHILRLESTNEQLRVLLIKKNALLSQN